MPALPKLRFAALSVLALVVMLGVTSARPSAAAPGVPGAGSLLSSAAPNVCVNPPTEVSTDEDGYTLWTVDYVPAGCYRTMPPMYRPVIRHPFDLGNVDPSELEDVSLTVWYFITTYEAYEDGSYGDMNWTATLNPSWDTAGYYGGTELGTLSFTGGELRRRIFKNINPVAIVDGENNFWLKPNSIISGDNGTTAYDIARYQLRATVSTFDVDSVTPDDSTENAPYLVNRGAGVSVTFTAPYDPHSLNDTSFQLWYTAANGDPVLVPGKFDPVYAAEYDPSVDGPVTVKFTPNADLKDGVLYTARLWGKDDADAEQHTGYAKSKKGGILKLGTTWTFWTAPKLRVSLVPAQVLENVVYDNPPLIVNKGTVLKVFVRWDSKPDVHPEAQLASVLVDDVALSWTGPAGGSGSVSWRADPYGWDLPYDDPWNRRKREYTIFTTIDESYDKIEKLQALDSVNYFGFIPLYDGDYNFVATVYLRDGTGKRLAPPASASLSQRARVAASFRVNGRVMAVGTDTGQSGTVDKSDPIDMYLNTLRAAMPVSSVLRPGNSAAMPWYTPTTSLWAFSWDTTPAWGWVEEYLLSELNRVCLRTTGCRVMVGFVPKLWMDEALGLTEPESYPRGALVSDTMEPDDRQKFVFIHEIGHTQRWPTGEFWCDEGLPSSEGNCVAASWPRTTGADGYRVGARSDKRSSVVEGWEPRGGSIPSRMSNYMYFSPQEYPVTGDYMWVDAVAYMNYVRNVTGMMEAKTLRSDADQLVLVAGGIVPATGETRLAPWYLLPAGEYTTPDPGSYSLVFKNGTTEIAGYTRSFGIPAAINGVALPTNQPAFFSFKVPFPAGATSAEIHQGSVTGPLLQTRVFSSAGVTPTVTPISPASGALSATATFGWGSTNAGATPAYAVDFSGDGGATWEPLALDLTSTSLTISTASFANTTTGQIRVTVTDGLRTGSLTAGPYTLANAPVVTGKMPAAGATLVGVNTPIRASFRDAMNASTLTTATFTVTGPGGSVDGNVSYDAAEREATFQPKGPLAFNTTYTVTLTTGIQAVAGGALAAPKTWTFTTQPDLLKPRPSALSPEKGVVNVPRNATLSVVWDKPMNAATQTASTFTLVNAKGAPVNVAGTVTYNAATRMATFTPSAALAAKTMYVATLAAGIADTLGNTTTTPYKWSFTTGSLSVTATALAGSYDDYGSDTNGDSLYEALVVRVGVHATEAATYNVQASLVDINGERIGSASTQAPLPVGFSWVDLAFSGQEIGGHGVDGPYRLVDVVLFKLNASNQPLLGAVSSAQDAAWTRPYPVSRFASVLSLAGMPDVRVLPGNTLPIAFNVHAYTQTGLSPVTYSIVGNTDPTAGIALDTAGNVSVNPPAGQSLPWELIPPYRGSTNLTIEAMSGANRARDTFQVVVDWASRIALPRLVRGVTPSTVAPSVRPTWQVRFTDNFESSLGWVVWAGMSCGWNQPDCVLGWYYPAITTCKANSGTHSIWPFGGGEDGEKLACGAPYPNGFNGWMGFAPGVSLKHTSAAQFRLKVWTNLDPGDQVCAMVALSYYSGGIGQPSYFSDFYGTCRSGQTNGWEDLVLDLSNVPGKGNLLGTERVWPVVKFTSTEHVNMPEGAYIDDAVFRLCPEGLQCQ